jgi:hypothetical protein
METASQMYVYFSFLRNIIANIVRASNAKDTVVGATATAKDTLANEAQATVNDVQGLSASAQKAANDSNGHPLAKYHSVGTSPIALFAHDSL